MVLLLQKFLRYDCEKEKFVYLPLTLAFVRIDWSPLNFSMLLDYTDLLCKLKIVNMSYIHLFTDTNQKFEYTIILFYLKIFRIATKSGYVFKVENIIENDY